MTDLRILARLASYHAERIFAGECYATFTRSHDVSLLDDAIEVEGRAIEEWEKLVKAAGDVYADDLLMGRRSVDLCGHWRDELAALRKGFAALQEERRQFKPAVDSGPTIAHAPFRKFSQGRGLWLSATIAGPRPIKTVNLILDSANGGQLEIPMQLTNAFIYKAILDREQIRDGIGYSIVAEDVAGHRATFPAGTNRLHIMVSPDTAPPAFFHTPVTQARPGQPLRITALVSDPSKVKWVRLRFRPVNQTLDYDTLEMHPTGKPDEYEAVVPGDKIVSKWDFMYFFEVMDQAGNGKIYPDFEKETPYIVVKLQR